MPVLSTDVRGLFDFWKKHLQLRRVVAMRCVWRNMLSTPSHPQFDRRTPAVDLNVVVSAAVPFSIFFNVQKKYRSYRKMACCQVDGFRENLQFRCRPHRAKLGENALTDLL